MNTKIFRFQGLALIWAVIILVLCNMHFSASTGGVSFFEGFDKMVHLGLFFVLTILLIYGKIKAQKNYAFDYLTILKILLITALFGACIELMQWKIFTWRSAEWWDFYCDMIGVGMAIFSYTVLHLKNYNEKNI